MSILKLLRDRQMYKHGKRVGFEPGGMAGEYGMGAGVGRDGQTDGQRSSGNDRPNMADIAGPVRGPVDMSHFGDTGDTVQADFTPYNQRPDTITSFMDNYGANLQSNGLKNLIPGMGVYNLLNTINQTNKAQGLLGILPNPSTPYESNDGEEGIMNLPQPDMYATSEEVDETTEGGEEDYVQRFQVKDEFRKAKGADLGIENAAIAEMISKLYS